MRKSDLDPATRAALFSLLWPECGRDREPAWSWLVHVDPAARMRPTQSLYPRPSFHAMMRYRLSHKTNPIPVCRAPAGGVFCITGGFGLLRVTSRSVAAFRVKGEYTT